MSDPATPTGDLANEHGDIAFSGSTVIAEGRLAVTFAQAFRAIRHGWRLVGTHDEFVLIQRGGEQWRSRTQPGKTKT